MTNEKKIKEMEELTKYREVLENYKKHKDLFENPQSSIQVEGNVAFIQPLNNIENHLQKNQPKRLNLTRNNNGYVTLKIVGYLILLASLTAIGISIAVHLRGV